jgi:anti-anti-sigma factor
MLTRVCGGYVVAALRWELDTADAESAAGAVAALTADGRQLIIDLETLDFIDCHAVGALLGVREAAQQAGGVRSAAHDPGERWRRVPSTGGRRGGRSSRGRGPESGPGRRGGFARTGLRGCPRAGLRWSGA